MPSNGNGSSGLGHGYYFEDLSVGMEASYAKKISNDDILAFAEKQMKAMGLWKDWEQRRRGLSRER